jgi:integrase
VTDLRWTDINFTEGFIRKTIGKTGREATIPISGTLRKALTDRKTRKVVSEFAIVNSDGHRWAEEVIDNYHGIAKAIATHRTSCPRPPSTLIRQHCSVRWRDRIDAQGFLRPLLNEDGSAVLSASSAAMKMVALALDGTDGMDTNSDTNKSDRQSG